MTAKEARPWHNSNREARSERERHSPVETSKAQCSRWPTEEPSSVEQRQGEPDMRANRATSRTHLTAARTSRSQRAQSRGQRAQSAAEPTTTEQPAERSQQPGSKGRANQGRAACTGHKAEPSRGRANQRPSPTEAEPRNRPKTEPNRGRVRPSPQRPSHSEEAKWH